MKDTPTITTFTINKFVKKKKKKIRRSLGVLTGDKYPYFTPSTRYRWVKNGHDFLWQNYSDRISQQPGRGTLVITKPDEVDIGKFDSLIH